ncbi:MAG: IS3 family transposase, partial [Actinomycetota bacterium]|nr:IS3 family transposase [Actinomycetota bacterium]
MSRSAYYAWAASRRSRRSLRERSEARLVASIRRIHTDSDGTYGTPRVTRQLRHDGHVVNRKRVERLMRLHGIVGHRPRRRRSLTRQDTNAAPAPDLLGRLFDPDRPDVAWCGDLTYIRTDEGWLYLASLLDLSSRALIGWSMSDRHDAALACAALGAAVATRGRRRMNDVNMHTDRGAEGGFNWSSQHLEMRSCDGSSTGVGSEGNGALADVVAGATAGRA